MRTQHPSGRPHRVQDVVDVLDAITRGRLSTPPGRANPWHVTKSSGLAGKAVTETPGLVMGDREAPVRRLAVAMTLTEHHIELARAIGVDAIVAHHPIADAASSGGVALKDYLPRYDLAVLECHEAFHGLHPGIAFLHGHEPFRTEGAFRGVHGKVVMVGHPLAGVETLEGLLDRLRGCLEHARDTEVLEAERAARRSADIRDSVTAPGMQILSGGPETPVGKTVIHAFPHTGFDADDLEALLGDHPEAGTLVLSISGVGPEDDLVRAARRNGLGVVVGSSHSSEILENGLPLTHALDELLPGLDVLLFRDRVVALPLDVAAPGHLAGYARQMGEHLVTRAHTVRDTTPTPATPAPAEVVLTTPAGADVSTGGRS